MVRGGVVRGGVARDRMVDGDVVLCKPYLHLCTWEANWAERYPKANEVK